MHQTYDYDLPFGGKSTAPDIQKIREQWPDDSLKVGQIIRYEAMEDLLGEERWSHRFKTVTNRWRKLVENETQPLIVGVEREVGFKILTDHDKVDLTSTKLRSAGRAARRSYKVSTRVTVRNLDDSERRRLEHARRISGTIIAVSQTRSGKDPFNDDKVEK